MDVLGGWSKGTEISVQSLVGRKTTHLLERIQKAVLLQELSKFYHDDVYFKIDRIAMNSYRHKF